MAGTKFLNLDDYADPKRTVTLKGKEYEVRGMTVERFLDAMKAEQEFEKVKDDPAKQFDGAINSIRIAIPEIPEADLRGLTFRQLEVLMEFVRGELDNQAQEAAMPKAVPAEGTEGN